ncbi:MAG: hypothetical protein LBH60_06935, partial [Prevotellaceae bacterium]|nr:hypothetical protein [Prevotellaceae bacterium]
MEARFFIMYRVSSQSKLKIELMFDCDDFQFVIDIIVSHHTTPKYPIMIYNDYTVYLTFIRATAS